MCRIYIIENDLKSSGDYPYLVLRPVNRFHTHFSFLIESIYECPVFMKVLISGLNQYFLSVSLFVSASGCVLYQVIQCDAN